jgi:hypothetical protein
MKIPQRIAQSLQNSIELFLEHSLLAWNLIRHCEGHNFFWEIVKFSPALKDGQPVSVSVMVEYTYSTH